jgi:hypothetical protein
VCVLHAQVINTNKIFGGNHQVLVHVADLCADGGHKLRKDDRDVECESLNWNHLA